jgi:RNA polymerase sigma factor (sigma-70 family)
MGIDIKNRRVDYSALVTYLQEDNTRKVNQLLDEMIPKLIEYLQVTIGVNTDIARECVQQAFLNVYERIIGGELKDPKTILSYMMQTSRNEYFNYRRKNSKLVAEELIRESVSEPAEQIERLIDEERKTKLFKCIEELDDDSQLFILYFMNHPDATTKEASSYFGMSEANVRTKKYRITHQLHALYRYKE